MYTPNWFHLSCMAAIMFAKMAKNSITTLCRQIVLTHPAGLWILFLLLPVMFLSLHYFDSMVDNNSLSVKRAVIIRQCRPCWSMTERSFPPLNATGRHDACLLNVPRGTIMLLQACTWPALSYAWCKKHLQLLLFITLSLLFMYAFT